MNIHPIVVHFPIALLIVYAGIEVISYFSARRSEKLYRDRLKIEKMIVIQDIEVKSKKGIGLFNGLYVELAYEKLTGKSRKARF